MAQAPNVRLLTEESASRVYVPRHVHVFACDGQSNMSGRGIPYSSFSDPVNSRIKQFPGRGASVGAIIPASEPLIMHDTASGIGPALQFARNLLSTLPAEDIILLVPNAHGGTMLPTTTTPLGWRWGVAGNLSAQAVANTTAALAAAALAYPGATVTLDAVLWLEGETAGTNSIAGSVYQTDLDALITGYRTYYGIPNLPFIMGGMVVEALSVGTRTDINIVHSDTPYRMSYTGWTPGVAGKQNGDNLHYNSAGQVEVGKGMFNEYLRVVSGRRPVYASLVPPVIPPVTVPTPGAALFEDTFNRTDTAELTTSDTSGKSWQKDVLGTTTAKLGITSNEAAPIYTTTGGNVFYTGEAGTAAVQLHADFTVTHSSFRLVFWYTDNQNYIAMSMPSATTVDVRRYVGGVNTTLKTYTVSNATSRVIDVVARSASDVSIWVDGTSVMQNEAISGLTPATRVGLQVASVSGVQAGRINELHAYAIAA